MKILKNSLIILLFTIFGCNSDQSSLDVIGEEQNISINQTNSVETYSLEEILNGMRAWEDVRSNESELLELFNNFNSLNINMALFPQGSALHAYACVINGELKFAVISEVYDNAAYHDDGLGNYIHIVDAINKDITPVINQTYENYTFSLPTQYIQADDAINRIKDWNANYTTWLNNNSEVYQGFDIPTYSLQAQDYTVYFGLKNNVENPSVKDADLVFDNNKGLFYDSMRAYPPLIHQEKYYILELI